MLIADRFMHNGHIFVACVGDDISRDFACTSIHVDGSTYKVKAFEARNSFSDRMQALLEIEGTQLPPLGECTIMN